MYSSQIVMWWATLCLLCLCGVNVSAERVAVIGGGVGGTAAAYFLRQSNPTWHIELFERERIGGRVEEVTIGGRVLELGASIIHGANHYMLSLARKMNLTLNPGDDTGAAFNIWNGQDFVFGQTGSTLSDLWAVAKRYGVSPLRYKWLSEDAGRRFGGIYDLQQRSVAFTTPEAWLEQLGLFNVTQQSAAEYMKEHLTRGLLRYGAGPFIEELAGATNRINYNQHNEQLNALAGLVSYLPAANPEVYSIKEGNAALPRKLIHTAALQALHAQTAVQSVAMDDKGQFFLALQPLDPSSTTQHQHSKFHPPEQQQEGPFDAVIVATPLEGSGIKLQGLDPEPELPPRTYQSTTTSFVAGYLDAAYFNHASMPQGDVFVTNSADTPFTVVSSKGMVSASAVHQASRKKPDEPNTPCKPTEAGSAGSAVSRVVGAALEGVSQHPVSSGSAELQGEQEPPGPELLPLWKVFSEEPLSWHTLRTLFVNGTVVASKSWAAYPRFNPPEKFAPFLLGPGLCYNNAMENAASAMEVAAVAAKNCALLVQQHVRERQDKAASATATV